MIAISGFSALQIRFLLCELWAAKDPYFFTLLQGVVLWQDSKGNQKSELHYQVCECLQNLAKRGYVY